MKIKPTEKPQVWYLVPKALVGDLNEVGLDQVSLAQVFVIEFVHFKLNARKQLESHPKLD